MEVLGKLRATSKSNVPVIPNELAEADGFIFGFPTRFEVMAAQFKAFLYATGGLWKTQQLAGKPAGIFYSTSSHGGGQETTALTAITQLVHHGMIFVPIGYIFSPWIFEMVQVVEVHMVQQLLLVMAQDSQLILSWCKRGTKGILSPPSQSSSKKLRNVASI